VYKRQTDFYAPQTLSASPCDSKLLSKKLWPLWPVCSAFLRWQFAFAFGQNAARHGTPESQLSAKHNENHVSIFFLISFEELIDFLFKELFVSFLIFHSMNFLMHQTGSMCMLNSLNRTNVFTILFWQVHVSESNPIWTYDTTVRTMPTLL